jgi:cytidylate kinase
MTALTPISTVAEAILRAESRRAAAAGAPATTPPATIALSRQPGTRGRDIAQAVGRQLNWPVYDHEILERIAEDLRVSVRLLEQADERPGNWLAEWAEVLSSGPSVNEMVYAQRLRKLLPSIAALGSCVIVGRGAPHFLPPASTLRVRLAAPLPDRVAVVALDRGLDADAAARFIEQTAADRERFIRDHFRHDASDPANYDLVLNTSRFSPDQCAAQILSALRAFESLA